MSNKLRKKRNLKPDGYDRKFAIHQHFKNAKLEDDCFVEVFYSLQYISYSALWTDELDGGCSFTVEMIKRFYECLNEYNDSFGNPGGVSWALQEVYKKQTGFDCAEEARKFSFRAKMKMYGKKLKTKRDYEIAINSTTDAVGIYLILAVHTLRKDFAFSGEMVRRWWDKCLEVAELYTRGMTDEFIAKFLEEECGLKIAE